MLQEHGGHAPCLPPPVLEMQMLQVDPQSNLINAYMDDEGLLQFERIGNLHDVKPLNVKGVADIKLGEEGTVLWAFTDSKEPLIIDPFALVQKDRQVRSYLYGRVTTIWRRQLELSGPARKRQMTCYHPSICMNQTRVGEA
jgi:hypothetical protein